MTVRPHLAGFASTPRNSLLVVLRVLLGGVLVLAFAFVFATRASASEHFFSASFGSVGSGAGQFALASPVVVENGGFKRLASGGSGLAVNNEAGDVYVADTGNHRIDEFEANGTFGRAWGWGVQDGLAKFEECTALSTCQAGVSGPGPGEFESPTFIAVDNSSGASKGDVYVGDASDGVVSKFTAEGALIESWGVGGQLVGGECEKPGESLPCSGSKVVPFGSLAGIAVGLSSGTLYVDHPGLIFTFEQGGNSASAPFHASGANEPGGLAVDAAGNIYAIDEYTVEQYSPSGAQTKTVFFDPPPGFVVDIGFAVDSVNNDLYTDSQGTIVHHYALGELGGVRGPGGTLSPPPTDSFGAGDIEAGAGLAVNSSAETVYAADTGAGRIDIFSLLGPLPASDSASALTGTAATLNGRVIPTGGGPVTDCHFEYVEAAGYDPAAPNPYSAGQSAPCSPAAPIPSPTNVSAQLTGLKLSTVYHFRISATDSKATNHGADLTFRTHGAEIASESVSGVTATGATLNAQINPVGVPTTYYFQYSTSSTTGCDASPASCTDAPSAPGEPIGSVSGDVEVAPRHLQGLSPNTVYHYRVIALSEPGGEPITVEGPDHTFTTQSPAAPFSLPDGREWELVSPPDKHGALIEPILIGTLSTQASSNGGGMAYLTGSPTEADPAGNANLSQVISVRGPDGWVSRDISLPHSETTGFALQRPDYRMFSSDLSLAVVQPLGPFDPALSAEASEQTAYLRSDYSRDEPGGLCATSCYRPLVTAVPGFADLPAGIEFGVNRENGEKCPPGPLCGPELIGATPDLSHVVLYSGVGLTSTSGENGYLYEWSGGSQLQPVGVLPDGKPAGAKSGPGQGAGGYHVGPSVVRNAVSADGSRVFFTNSTTGLLYVREGIGTAQARTVPVPGGVFQTASVDGSRVFVLGGGALSEFDVETEVSTPLANGVQGVIGASEDGSSVYFVSNTVLTGEVKNGSGAKAQAGQPNLYLSRGGVTTFIATLSQEDAPDWSGVREGEVSFTARVSPDGSWLAFMSQRSLTGYDNRDALSGMPDEEVYLYRAPVAGGGGGALACASCDPTGARPHGIEYERLEFTHGTGLVSNGADVWPSSQWLAANVPAWTSLFYQSRYLSDSGRLFFDSADALVPQDTNGTEDVYEYEPPGVGSCSSESATFARASGGCVSLISSGTSSEESGFLDASETGGDVFFVTKARLAPQDVDSSFDVYDAHECTSEAPCLPAPPLPVPACDGDACQPPVSPPSDLSPASFTFSGSGNVNPAAATVVATRVKGLTRAQRLAGALKQCRKRSKRKRPACEKHARRAYGSERKAATSRKGGSR